MKVIAGVNNKGGVGKTKVSTLLCEYFSLVENKKVLGIDFDPQCNFSRQYLDMEEDPSSPEGVMPPVHEDYDANDPDNQGWDGRTSIADIFYGQPILPYQTHIKNFEITPGYGDKLLKAELVRRTEVQEKVHSVLEQFLSCPEVRDSYDIVVIDTAPSKGPLTVAAIRAATHLLIPTIMEEQPIQGLYGMLQLWMQESHRRASEGIAPLEITGILANKYKVSTTLHRNLYESLCSDPSIKKYMLPMTIGDRIIYAEVDSAEVRPKSVFELENSSVAKKEALELCEFVSKKIYSKKIATETT